MAELPQLVDEPPWYGVQFVGHIDFSVGAQFGMWMSPGFGEAHPEWTMPGSTFTVEAPTGARWQAELLDRPQLVDGGALLRMRFNQRYDDPAGQALAPAGRPRGG